MSFSSDRAYSQKCSITDPVPIRRKKHLHSRTIAVKVIYFSILTHSFLAGPDDMKDSFKPVLLLFLHGLGG